MSDNTRTPEALAIDEWNRLVNSQVANRPHATLADAIQFEGRLLIAHALLLGLTCIASAIRGRP